jgi:serine/threonine protein phosphatase PrpC
MSPEVAAALGQSPQVAVARGQQAQLRTPASPMTTVWDSAPWCGNHKPSRLFASIAADANEEFRPYMEDGHKVAPLNVGLKGERWTLYAVYDGHGGREAVDHCEAHLHHMIAAELESRPMHGDFGSRSDRKEVSLAIARAFAKIDGQLKAQGAEDYGCTATVMLVQDTAAGRTLHVANVGDSKGMLIGGDLAKQMTVDHHTCNPAECVRVEQDGGFVMHKRVCGILSVTRALGDHSLKHGGVSCLPDVMACRVEVPRAMVLASDGLWDVMSGVEVQELLEDSIQAAAARGGDSEEVSDRLSGRAARALVNCAKERGSHDNILALVVFV